MSNETKTKYQVRNSKGEVIGTRSSKRAYTHAIVINDSEVFSYAGSFELANARTGDIWITYRYGKDAAVTVLPVEAVEATTRTVAERATCSCCGGSYTLTKAGKVRHHNRGYSRVTCEGAGKLPAEAPTAEAPAAIEAPTGAETRVDEINAEIKSLQEERSREFRGAWVAGYNREILELERERADLLYGTEEPSSPVEEEEASSPVEEEPSSPAAEEARCYHVTRCKFDPRGNPSAWSTDSSYATLEEARARAAELVAELGGEVDPSSLSAHSCETVGDVGIQLVYDTLPARDNSKTYVGAHNGAYLYETSPVEEDALEPLVKGLPALPEEEETLATGLREGGKLLDAAGETLWVQPRSLTLATAALGVRVQIKRGEVIYGSYPAAELHNYRADGVAYLPYNLDGIARLPVERSALLSWLALPEAPEEEPSSPAPILCGGLHIYPEAPEEEEPSSPEEEARVIRVTPPQGDALRALGYEVSSCKLSYYPSQVEELLERLYAEREQHTRGGRRVYTSLIERVSKPKSKIKRAKGAPRAFFNSGDLRIEYTSDSSHRQLMQLVDAAQETGLISAASARALRASCAPPRALSQTPEGEEDTGSSALARFMGR